MIPRTDLSKKNTLIEEVKTAIINANNEGYTQVEIDSRDMTDEVRNSLTTAGYDYFYNKLHDTYTIDWT